MANNVKMPQDYWRELADKVPMNKPGMETSLLGTFYFGCMVSAMFMSEVAALESDAERKELLDKWAQDIEVHTGGMMRMWMKERDGGS